MVSHCSIKQFQDLLPHHVGDGRGGANFVVSEAVIGSYAGLGYDRRKGVKH